MRAELELWKIFSSVDLNGDGKIEKGELRGALGRAGITVDPDRLESFFHSIDQNNDGVISFEEWRCVSYTTKSVRATADWLWLKGLFTFYACWPGCAPNDTIDI